MAVRSRGWTLVIRWGRVPAKGRGTKQGWAYPLTREPGRAPSPDSYPWGVWESKPASVILALLAVVIPLAVPSGAAGHAREFCPPDGEIHSAGPALSRVSTEALEAGADPEGDIKERAEGESPDVRPLRGAVSSGRRARASALITIPVHFHVLRKDDGVTGNLTDEEIETQIQTLNDSFDGTTGGDDTGFRFELASVDRSDSDLWFSQPIFASSSLHRGGIREMNVYSSKPATGDLGFVRYLPGEGPTGVPSDMVVIDYESIPGGSLPAYNEGDTLVHEAGHWLGLEHTFKQSANGQGDLSGCFGEGDGVDDTPAEHEPYRGDMCTPGLDTCPAPGLDPINNFMNYSDDICMFEFTPGQGDRMHQRTAAFRNTAPVIGPGGLDLEEGESGLVGSVDAEGDAHDLVATTQPSSGSLSSPLPGTFTYTPAPGFEGLDSFTLSATDSLGSKTTREILVQVGDVAPGLTLDLPRRSKLGKARAELGCDSSACEIELSGKIVVNKRRGRGAAGKLRREIRTTRVSLDQGDQDRVKPRVDRRTRRKVRRLVDRGGRAKLKLVAEATSIDGTVGRERGRVRLK